MGGIPRRQPIRLAPGPGGDNTNFATVEQFGRKPSDPDYYTEMWPKGQIPDDKSTDQQ